MSLNNVNKNPKDPTVCRYLFTAKLLYMFGVSQHSSSVVLKTVPAASGTGHTTCTATPLQRGLIGTGLCESHASRRVEMLQNGCLALINTSNLEDNPSTGNTKLLSIL